MINLPNMVCAASISCTLATGVDIPGLRAPGTPYDPAKSCYVYGEFHRQCPQEPEHRNWMMTTKAEYKKQLLTYIEAQLDKLTVKQIRVLISSYAQR